jgi:hypothetical protein
MQLAAFNAEVSHSAANGCQFQPDNFPLRANQTSAQPEHGTSFPGFILLAKKYPPRPGRCGYAYESRSRMTEVYFTKLF